MKFIFFYFQVYLTSIDINFPNCYIVYDVIKIHSLKPLKRKNKKKFAHNMKYPNKYVLLSSLFLDFLYK